MLTRQEIIRALAAVFETSRGHTSLATYRAQFAARLGELFRRRVLIGTLDAYAESILASDSYGRSFALPFDATTPLGDVLFIDADHPVDALRAIALPNGIAASAVLGARVGAFIGIAVPAADVHADTLVELAYQTTLAMEVILERAESFREAEVMSQEARAKSDLLATVSHEIDRKSVV